MATLYVLLTFFRNFFLDNPFTDILHSCFQDSPFFFFSLLSFFYPNSPLLPPSLYPLGVLDLLIWARPKDISRLSLTESSTVKKYRYPQTNFHYIYDINLMSNLVLSPMTKMESLCHLHLIFVPCMQTC